MFSSLASFIFGSNTSATTNSEENNQPSGERAQQQADNENLVRIDAENTINVTSTTPSVTGSTTSCEALANTARQAGKRSSSSSSSNNNGPNNNNNNKGNTKRNNKHNNRNRARQNAKGTPTITKLLTPNESSDEDLDEDDWFIVEKEDEADSLPRTDSEEELSVVEVKSSNNNCAASQAGAAAGQQRQRRQHINSHSLYSGPRPQQQRNLLQRARNSGARSNVGSNAAASSLSPPRNGAAGSSAAAAAADVDCISQSLYVTAPTIASIATNNNVVATELGGANVGMEESWFVTPPPCFTSIGPINMETSPYENLLIEHPSMSVYHSIRSAQEAAESFVNLDLGMGETSHPRHRPVVAAAVSVTAPAEATVAVRNAQPAAPQQPRATSARADRFTAAQIKQELFARSTQKSHDKKERQYLCRGAIKRSNKARDFQSRGNHQRRSDMQHCKLLSGANNNRKCCF